jgi:hypothetical protein
MNTVLWIVAGLLAALFLLGGMQKLTQSKEKLIGSGFGVFEPFSAGTIKIIGLLELLGAVGLILPAVLDIAPVLVPLAAVGLVLLMIGAAIAHGRRREFPQVAVNLIILALAAFVAWGRFGPHSFTG